MSETSAAQLLDFYRKILAGDHDDAAKVGWENLLSQRLRFEALVAGLDLTPGATLLDVGCGLGDLWAWLKATGREVDYLGIDLSPEMVEAARLRHPDARFEVADVLTHQGQYDFVISVGSLGVAFGTPEESWALVEAIFALCLQGAAFNLLVKPDGVLLSNLRSEYWYVEPLEAHRRLREISPRLSILEGLLPTDLFVQLFRRHIPLLSGHLGSHLREEDVAELRIQRREPVAALQRLGNLQGPRADAVRGLAHAQLGQGEAALRAFQRAFEARPSDTDNAINLVALSGAVGAVEEAEAVYAQVRDEGWGTSQTRDEVRLLLHEILVDETRLERAASLEAEAEDPWYQNAMAGRRLLRQGERPAAREALEEALRLRPHDLRPYLLLGKLGLRDDDVPTALRSAAVVLQYEARHPEARNIAFKGLHQLGALPPEERHGMIALLRDHPVLGPLVSRMAGASGSQ